MSALRRISRGSHWVIGKYVIVDFGTWDGWSGREAWTRSLLPVDQSSHQMHPKHLTGFCTATGERNACIAASCSFYSELCKWAGFRWSRQAVSA